MVPGAVVMSINVLYAFSSTIKAGLTRTWACYITKFFSHYLFALMNVIFVSLRLHQFSSWEKALFRVKKRN